MNKKRITAKMQEMGMAWAVTSKKIILPDDGWEAKPSYHVHPDASYPHQNSIKKFYNLNEVAGYVAAREAADKAATPDEALKIMQDWECSLQ